MSPIHHFCTGSQANSLADRRYTKQRCSRLFQAKCDFTQKMAVLFLEPLGETGAYGFHSMQRSNNHAFDRLGAGDRPLVALDPTLT